MKYAFILLITLLQNSYASENTFVNLHCFKSYAAKVIKKSYGNIELTNPSITFHDGVGSYTHPPLYDYSRLVFSADVIDWSNNGLNARASYTASLQGFDKTMLVVNPVSENVIYNSANSIITTLLPGKEKEFHQLQDELEVDFPKYIQRYFQRIRAFILSGEPINHLPLIYKKLNDSNIFQNISLDAETYRVPYQFDKPILLGSFDEQIDLDTLRTISQKYKDAGIPFTTSSHLSRKYCYQ